MQLTAEARALLDRLLKPERHYVFDLANSPDPIGADLALAHIELMRADGETVPTPLLALEQLLFIRNKIRRAQ
jgi:hypothetical protein